MSAEVTYSLAHTARCKLRMAADKPDRNLRFILGHAFTLDKIMLRVVEIETESESSSDDDTDTPNDTGDAVVSTLPGQRRVSFPNNARPQAVVSNRHRSPPPDENSRDLDGSEEDDQEDYEDDEDEEGDELSLRRFASAAAGPPRLVDDQDGDSDDDDNDAPVSPTLPIDVDIQSITEGPESAELVSLYQNVQKCPCHGHHQDAPTVAKAWEMPRKAGTKGTRVAVIQVES